MLTLKSPWADGTRQLLFEPLTLLEKLAALIPRPRNQRRELLQQRERLEEQLARAMHHSCFGVSTTRVLEPPEPVCASRSR